MTGKQGQVPPPDAPDRVKWTLSEESTQAWSEALSTPEDDLRRYMPTERVWLGGCMAGWSQDDADDPIIPGFSRSFTRSSFAERRPQGPPTQGPSHDFSGHAHDTPQPPPQRAETYTPTHAARARMAMMGKSAAAKDDLGHADGEGNSSAQGQGRNRRPLYDAEAIARAAPVWSQIPSNKPSGSRLEDGARPPGSPYAALPPSLPHAPPAKHGPSARPRRLLHSSGGQSSVENRLDGDLDPRWKSDAEGFDQGDAYGRGGGVKDALRLSSNQQQLLPGDAQRIFDRMRHMYRTRPFGSAGTTLVGGGVCGLDPGNRLAWFGTAHTAELVADVSERPWKSQQGSRSRAMSSGKPEGVSAPQTRQEGRNLVESTNAPIRAE